MPAVTFDIERAGRARLYHARAGRGSARQARALSTPLWLLTNALFAALQYPAFRTARVSIHPPGVRSGRRVRIYYTWHGLSWVSHVAFRAVPRTERPVSIAHDGPASRLNQRASVWYGFDMLVFARHMGVTGRDQIVEFLRVERRGVMIFPDSGGPYGILKPGMLEIARRAQAELVPFVVHTRGAPSVGRRMRHRVPLPFCRVELEFGEALLPESTTLDACARALEHLDRSS